MASSFGLMYLAAQVPCFHELALAMQSPYRRLDTWAQVSDCGRQVWPQLLMHAHNWCRAPNGYSSSLTLIIASLFARRVPFLRAWQHGVHSSGKNIGFVSFFSSSSGSPSSVL